MLFFARQTDIERDILLTNTDKCCDKEQLATFSLSFSKGPCYGTCPIYKVDISSDRSLVAIGYGFTEFKRVDKLLSSTQIESIAKTVFAANFFDLKNVYGYEGRGCAATATDSPYTAWSVKIGSSENEVKFYKGCIGVVVE